MRRILFPLLAILFVKPLSASDEFEVFGAELYPAIQRVMATVLSRSNASFLPCQGRLTLSSGNPVPTSDVTAATTVYFTPYDGDLVALYSGSVWQLVSFTETSVAVPSTTTTPFDVFAYNNSGTLTLETVNWTNDTTRATSLTTQNGVQVKSGAATRRYIGTGRTTSSSGQSEDSTSRRFLWNMCNRSPRKLLAQSATASWNYTTASWRPANNDTSTGVTRFESVTGLGREAANFEIRVGRTYNGSYSNCSVGFGVNSTSSAVVELQGGDISTYYYPVTAFYSYVPSVGYTYIQWLEWCQANGTSTWYGYSSTSGSLLVSGMHGYMWN
jgi:hypothetical protein